MIRPACAQKRPSDYWFGVEAMMHFGELVIVKIFGFQRP